MRIPANSCRGCNQEAPLLESGVHSFGDGSYERCAFVREEMSDFHDDLILIGCYQDRKKAVHVARRGSGSLLWIGQSPRQMWLVVR